MTELAGTGIQTHQIAMSRIQRIQAAESIFFFKKPLLKGWQTVMLFYLSIGGTLYETTTSYCCHPVSEYYVFALRRIIV